jgi:hypothetical protein
LGDVNDDKEYYKDVVHAVDYYLHLHGHGEKDAQPLQ